MYKTIAFNGWTHCGSGPDLCTHSQMVGSEFKENERDAVTMALPL